MKVLFILVLACAIFGTSGYFAYELFIKPEIELKREKEAPPTPAPPEPTLPQFNACVALKRQGKLLEARAAFYEYIEQNPQSSVLDAAKRELGELNVRLFLSAVETPDKVVYIVKSGDVITRVAQKNKTTPELIMRANNLTGSMLRIGQRLYLPQPNFSLVISRKQQKVILSQNGRFFRQYDIVKWPPQLEPKKGAPPLPKQAGRIIDKIAWVEGARVIYSDKGYERARHWVVPSIRHATLYADVPPNADPAKFNKPPSGIAVSPAAASELGTLLMRGNPVILE